MNYKDLLVYLNIDDPSEFEYFEMMADLLESEDYIEQEAMYRLFVEADKNKISQMLDDYFEEIVNSLPGDSDDVYSLLEQVRMCLIGLIDIAEDDSDYRKFTDEFYKFREWYVIDSQVEVIPDNEDDPEDCQSLRDAITTARIDKLNGNNHRFNFEKGANYEVDGYTMSFAELAAIEDEEDL